MSLHHYDSGVVNIVTSCHFSARHLPSSAVNLSSSTTTIPLLVKCLMSKRIPRSNQTYGCYFEYSSIGGSRRSSSFCCVYTGIYFCLSNQYPFLYNYLSRWKVCPCNMTVMYQIVPWSSIYTSVVTVLSCEQRQREMWDFACMPWRSSLNWNGLTSQFSVFEVWELLLSEHSCNPFLPASKIYNQRFFITMYFYFSTFHPL